MKKEFQRLILLSAALAFAACSKTEFAEVSSDNLTSKAEIPLDPVDPIDNPVTPPVDPVSIPPVHNDPVFSSKLTSGVCKSDSSTNVLSCLKCDVPQVTQAPQLSAKAQALADIMYLACQIPNVSDPAYIPPTKERIIEKINRGSDLLYPETARTSQMSLVIAGLTNAQDSSLRKKMFGGLWYQPPYSDAFETYFGVVVQEAKSTFCWDAAVQTPQITGVYGLFSKEWNECIHGSDFFNCKEQPAYVKAQTYRSQLQNVLSKSISDPFVAVAPDPQKKCNWEKFEGDDSVAARAQLKKWKSEGRKVAMEVLTDEGVGMCGQANEASLVNGVNVVLASYICK